MALWLELVSCAFLRMMFEGDQTIGGWLNVQQRRYRYLVGRDHGNYVHIAIEYLACQVAWDWLAYRALPMWAISVCESSSALISSSLPNQSSSTHSPLRRRSSWPRRS